MVHKYNKMNNPYCNYYRERYAIALYEGGPNNDEYFWGMYDNVEGFAYANDKEVSSARTIVCKAFNKVINTIRLNGKTYTMHFIDMWDDDEDE